ncbi:MAG: gamma subclass chorismate mutase AroQ [Alphaproteobacteria bacterium]|nr:gamma subclass chorismate mutase AroQ [Alphaproteobacteria bacterium]
MKPIHQLAFALLLFCLAPQVAADTTIYLVRHAEKASDGTRDPDLTPAGHERAQWIAHYLADRGLTAVFSTNYKRTRQTAAPTAKMAGLPVSIYDPRALEEFAAELKAKDGTFLVVGHSNTTPHLANLLANSTLKYAGEDVYDQVIKVSLADSKSLSVSFSKPKQDHNLKVAALRHAIANRLAVMADVARYKWNNKLPIEAPQREAKIIDATVRRATKMDLDPAFARKAVSMQMAASKLLQQELFDAWTAHNQPAFTEVPSLADEIRPKIDVLTGQLLEAAGQAEFLMEFCLPQQTMAVKPTGADYSEAVWQAAVSGFMPDTDCIHIETAQGTR